MVRWREKKSETLYSISSYKNTSNSRPRLQVAAMVRTLVVTAGMTA